MQLVRADVYVCACLHARACARNAYCVPRRARACTLLTHMLPFHPGVAQEFVNPLGAGKKLGWVDPKQKKKMAKEKARLAAKKAKEAQQGTLKLAKDAKSKEAKAAKDAKAAETKAAKEAKAADAKAAKEERRKSTASDPGSAEKGDKPKRKVVKAKDPTKPVKPKPVSAAACGARTRPDNRARVVFCGAAAAHPHPTLTCQPRSPTLSGTNGAETARGCQKDGGAGSGQEERRRQG